MRMGIGLGVGINRSNYAQGIFGAYQSRVVADGGTTEAGACVDAGATALLQTASLLLIPSGYKATKLYSEIPTSGNGDFTWARTSTANRTNSSGNIELMATGVPRLSYMYGSCPAVLLEPQRTNLALRSEEFDNAYWTKRNSTITANATTSPDGTVDADELKDDTTAFLHDVWFAPTAYSSSTYFTISAFVKANTLSACRLIATQSGLVNLAFASFNLSTQATSVSVGGNFTNATSKIDSLSNGWFRVSLTFQTGTGGISSWDNSGGCAIRGEKPYQTQIYTGTGQSLFIYGAQLEAGAYPTTYIPTTSATATRVVDSFSRNNIYTNGLISASGGTWFIEMLNNIAYTRDASSQGIGIGDSSTTIANGLLIVNTGSGRQVIQKIISGTATSLFTTTTDTIKIAIKWNGTSADVFVNGTKQVSATAFTTTIMEFLNGNGIGIPRWIKTMALFSTPLSDTDCTTLTT